MHFYLYPANPEKATFINSHSPTTNLNIQFFITSGKIFQIVRTLSTSELQRWMRSIIEIIFLKRILTSKLIICSFYLCCEEALKRKTANNLVLGFKTKWQLIAYCKIRDDMTVKVYVIISATDYTEGREREIVLKLWLVARYEKILYLISILEENRTFCANICQSIPPQNQFVTKLTPPPPPELISR